MKTKILLTITAALAICGAVFGQSLEQQFQEADAELNRVYKKLRSHLNEAQKADLKKSQVDWIKEKDKAIGQLKNANEKALLLLEMTKQRTAFLNSFSDGSSSNAGLSHSSSSNGEQSEIKGNNSDGTVWEYKFLDIADNDPLQQKLVDLSGANLLYSNDKWIVTGSTSSVGYSRSRSTIKFYDARSLKLTDVLSVPNNVNHIDYSSTREQFLLVTHPAGRYCDDDQAAQALVIVDLKKKALERVDIWDGTLNFIGPFFCAPVWNGKNIQVLYKPDQYINARPSPNALCRGKVFRDIRIDFKSLSENEGVIAPSEISVNTASTDLAGIFRKVIQPIEEKNTPDGTDNSTEMSSPIGSARVVQAPESNGLQIVYHSIPGNIQKVNLAELRSATFKAEPTYFAQAGLFSNGVIYGTRSNSVLFFDPSGRKTIQIPTPKIEHKWPLPDGGEGQASLARADFVNQHRVVATGETNMQIFFGADGGYCFVENTASNNRNISYMKLSPSGEISNYFVKIPDSIEGSLVTKIRIEPERSAIRLAVNPEDSPFGSFIELSMENSDLILGPLDSGTMLSSYDRKAGHAPNGWVVESVLVDAYSGGTDYAVQATDSKSGKVYSIFTGSATVCDRPPAMWLLSEKAALILSIGEAQAALHQLSLVSGSVKTVRSWTWDSSKGEAFFEPSKRFFFIPKDGGYNIFNLGSDISGSPIASLILTGLSDYAIVLPTGIYAGSPGCEALLRLNAGDGKLDGSSIALWRNRPAEVLKVLGGDPNQIQILAKVTERWHKRIGFDFTKPAPKVSDLPKVVVRERPPLWIKEQVAEFPVEWRRATSPVRSVIVRVNGVESSVFKGESLPDEGSVKAKVTLAEGHNWIEVVAEDAEGRVSDLQRFRTILLEAPSSAKRFIIAMGVSKYRDSSMDLEFAAKDATDLSNAIKESTSGPSEVLLLTNDQVTRDSIEKIRSFLANATENDEVVAFCAGHGVLDSNLDYVYASHEFDSANPSATGIKLDDLVDAVGSSKALKRLLLLDTCHAGQVGEKEEMLLAQMDTNLPSGVRAVKQRGMSVKPVSGLSAEGQQRFIEEMFLLPGLHRGINIIGASGGAEYALESAQWNNGVFTASIIEALRDKKADLNTDSRISVGELRDFLGQRVSELTKGAQKPSVVASERDQDFDLIRAASRPQTKANSSTKDAESAESKAELEKAKAERARLQKLLNDSKNLDL